MRRASPTGIVPARATRPSCRSVEVPPSGMSDARACRVAPGQRGAPVDLDGRVDGGARGMRGVVAERPCSQACARAITSAAAALSRSFTVTYDRVRLTRRRVRIVDDDQRSGVSQDGSGREGPGILAVQLRQVLGRHARKLRDRDHPDTPGGCQRDGVKPTAIGEFERGALGERQQERPKSSSQELDRRVGPAVRTMLSAPWRPQATRCALRRAHRAARAGHRPP